jgi:hypothetical protein
MVGRWSGLNHPVRAGASPWIDKWIRLGAIAAKIFPCAGSVANGYGRGRWLPASGGQSEYE